MREVTRVEVGAPIHCLSRSNRTVLGCHSGDLYEVDTLHDISFRTALSTLPIHLKHLRNCLHTGVYVCDAANLRTLSGHRLLHYSEASEFTGCFDSGHGFVGFAKHHPRHSKYSVSVLDLATSQQRILKLLDEAPGNLVVDDPEVLWSAANTVCSLDVNGMKGAVLDKGELLADSGYLFVREGLELRALERRSKLKAFELETKSQAFKVEVWRDEVIVGTDLGIGFYDRRKVARQVALLEVTGVRDFLYEPNIERAFVSAHNHLICYSL